MSADENGRIEPVDTEKIMTEIRERIKERGYKPADLTFRDSSYEEITDETVAAMTSEYNEHEYVRQLQCMEEYCDVEYSRYTAKGGVMGFIKKVIRRLATCAVLPVVEQINAFHGASLEAQMQTFNYVRTHEDTQLTDLRREVDELRAETVRLKEEIRSLKGGSVS